MATACSITIDLRTAVLRTGPVRLTDSSKNQER
jgi:hypothetical protein